MPVSLKVKPKISAYGTKNLISTFEKMILEDIYKPQRKQDSLLVNCIATIPENPISLCQTLKPIPRPVLHYTALLTELKLRVLLVKLLVHSHSKGAQLQSTSFLLTVRPYLFYHPSAGRTSIIFCWLQGPFNSWAFPGCV